MRIRVSGKDIDVGAALQGHVSAALTESMSKYAGRPTDATVTFGRDGPGFRCEVFVHLSTGLTAQSNGTAAECYAAFEAAREKMAKQLRRHKRRLKDHQARPVPVGLEAAGAGSAGSYVLAPFADDPDDEAPAPADEDAGEEAGEEVGEEAGPTIIAETETVLPSLSVSEAVMQMELAHAPVLVFRERRGGGLNVVYRRDDGNIGWIDPRESASESAGETPGRGG